MNTSQNNISRWTGLLYLGVVLTGIFSLMYVPERLINYNNAPLTFQNISEHETLFRFGIAGGLLCYIFFFFLIVFFYQILRKVHENIAKLMALLAMMSIPMYFLNVHYEITVLSLLKPADYLKIYTPEQLQTQILFYIKQYDGGMRLVHIFSGLWLFPLGYLIYKSGFLPKFLGLLLMFGCFGYLINFFGFLLIPDYAVFGISSYISLPASIGEIGTCLWLLIMGTNKKYIDNYIVND